MNNKLISLANMLEISRLLGFGVLLTDEFYQFIEFFDIERINLFYDVHIIEM